MMDLLDKLEKEHSLTVKEWRALIEGRTPELAEEVFSRARAVREREYGKKIYVRGLIECSNYCKNDCYYCGIRRSNRNAVRYRLSREEILDCCASGYELGFRTFVLQGGEDPAMTDDWVAETVAQIRHTYPDCAITLSLGEKEHDSYQRFYDAGADRYLLRHETADACHYGKLHPAELSFQHRMGCLADLKKIGYQTGCGFMVGSPHQTGECLAEDMKFIEEFQPQMVGIGPFIPQHDTPFKDEEAGSLELTVYLLGLLRLLLPRVLLPATTALGTIHPKGREMGILAGANVIMPNLSPKEVRSKYLLYDNKISTGDEAAESLKHLKESMAAIGYQVVVDRGDYKTE
ncbi:MAG: [FeFe] hydrogenase H-cluster radical SAM maturase HydE [Clostridium sp.]|nr:[FeFe] hydrogenase H-cluster radical SAM maturase HydE [Clostridium sp.]